MKNFYEELGVPPDASPEEIKKAYRKKIAKEHPDRKGGSKERAIAINEAWRVLGDERLRARYDALGEAETEDARRGRIIGELVQTFVQIASECDPLHDDIFALLMRKIVAAQAQNRDALQQLNGRIRRFEVVRKRLRRKKSEAQHAFFESAAESVMEECRRNIRMVEEKIEEKKLMVEILKDHSYEIDKRVELVFKGVNWGPNPADWPPGMKP